MKEWKINRLSMMPKPPNYEDYGKPWDDLVDVLNLAEQSGWFVEGVDFIRDYKSSKIVLAIILMSTEISFPFKEERT